MDDLLREFLTETSESLDTVDNQLVRFEQDPNNAKILDNIFRLVHTIKGTCGFLGLPRLEALAHAGETLMGKFETACRLLRKRSPTFSPASITSRKFSPGSKPPRPNPEGTDQDLIVKLQEMVERGMAAMSAQGGACRVSASCLRCAQGRAGHASAADAGASVASPAKCRWTSWSVHSRRPQSKWPRRRSRWFSPLWLRSRPQRP